MDSKPPLQSPPARSRPRSRERAPICIASLPPPSEDNPYQILLYRALAAHGVRVVSGARFNVDWLFQNRDHVRVLHFHWPHYYYRYSACPRSLRVPLDVLRACFFGVRLVVARVLGYRVVWTVHQPLPHERQHPFIDAFAVRLLALVSSRLIAHDEATADTVRSMFPTNVEKIVVIPHGPYTGFYPEGRPSGVVRRELDIPSEAFTLIAFGYIRAYKNIDVLLEAFAAIDDPDMRLLIAGSPHSDTEAERLRQSAALDDRVRLSLGFVTDDRVAELFAASDVAVVTRGDGGTSGALMLALSMGVPVIAPHRPAYEKLTGKSQAAWYFTPGDPQSLKHSIVDAASDTVERTRKAAAALAQAQSVSWDLIAEQTASVLAGDP